MRDSIQIIVELPAGLGPTGELTVNVEEGGRVADNGGSFSCDGPATCKGEFPRGGIITFSAIPDVGWEFEEWELCDSTSGTECTLLMPASKYIRAEFDPAP